VPGAAARQIARFFGAEWGRVDFPNRGMVFADSRYQAYKWEEKNGTDLATAATVARGVRVMTPDGSFADFTADGHFVRGALKLDDGNTVEIGRLADTWPSLEGDLPTGAARVLSWRNLTTGEIGERHLLGGGPGWIDTVQPGGVAAPRVVVRHTDPRGNVVSYLGPNRPIYQASPPPGGARFTPPTTGAMITRNTMGEIIGRRDTLADPSGPPGPNTVSVTGTGTPTRGTTWSWTDGTNSGLRISSRNHQWTGSWDDSFRDYQQTAPGIQTRIRDVRSLGKAAALFSWRDGTGTWHSEIRGPSGVVKAGSAGRREWRTADGRGWQADVPPGTDPTDWRDVDPANGQRVLREQAGGRVREYIRPRLVGQPSGTGEWREYDHGDVFRERKETSAGSGVYRESEKFHKQWRETDANGRLLRYRSLSGRVWERSPTGRWRLLPGTSFTLVGREFEYRGPLNQVRGYLRAWRESNRLQYAAVDGLVGTFVPRDRRVAQKAAFDFAQELAIDIPARILANAAVNRGRFRSEDWGRIFTAAAIGATIKTANSLLHDTWSPLKSWKDGIANVDGGKHYTRNPYNHDKHWDNEWAGPENPPRWRGTAYDYFQATLLIGFLASFTASATTSAAFGLPSAYLPLSGRDALMAGAIAGGGTLLSGIFLGGPRTLAVQLSSGRYFHRGGSADITLAFLIRFVERTIALATLRALGLRAQTPPHVLPGGGPGSSGSADGATATPTR